MSLKRCAAFAQGFDFRREVDGGSRAAAALLGVCLVHFLQVALKALVSLLPSVARVELRSLLFTVLMRVPSTATSSRPYRSTSRHSDTKLRNTGSAKKWGRLRIRVREGNSSRGTQD